MTALRFSRPPASICILRLSAIGDITHMLPIIATLRQHWPDTHITWIIGRVEYQLVKSLPDIEFIVFDKANGLKEYLRLRKKLAPRSFDILLMMQVALRASLASAIIDSPLKIGYDRARSRDFQRWFCNQFIEGPPRVHVLDGFFQFLEKIGIQQRNMDWLLQTTVEDREFVDRTIATDRYVVINPCSSARKNNWRNWSNERYAEIIDYLHEKQIDVVLTGGPDKMELAMAEEICRLSSGKPHNLVGKTTLTQLSAVIEKSLCVVAPDTGPAHIGTIFGKPVIGLFASSNPQRTGPYQSSETVINLYPQALKKFSGKTVHDAAWGERVRHPQVMALITTEMVKNQLDKLLSDNNSVNVR